MTGFVYFIAGSGCESPIKIGWTAGDPHSRLSELQTSAWEELRLVGAIRGEKKDEAALHRRFKHLCVRGEWFKPGADLLEYVKANSVQVPDREQRSRGRPPGQFAVRRAELMKWLVAGNLKKDLTNEEMAAAMDWSKSTVKRCIRALRDEGYLRVELRKCKGVNGKHWTDRTLEYTGKRGII